MVRQALETLADRLKREFNDNEVHNAMLQQDCNEKRQDLLQALKEEKDTSTKCEKFQGSLERCIC